jgi:hypothetical protein
MQVPGDLTQVRVRYLQRRESVLRRESVFLEQQRNQQQVNYILQRQEQQTHQQQEVRVQEAGRTDDEDTWLTINRPWLQQPVTAPAQAPPPIPAPAHPPVPAEERALGLASPGDRATLRINIMDDSNSHELINDGKDDTTCSICLEEMEIKKICKTDCNHLFHHTCIRHAMKIMKQNNTNFACPMCRSTIASISVTEKVALSIVTNSRKSIRILV